MTTLRDVWISKGMTSTQVAGLAGISVPTLYRMNRKEHGKGVNPRNIHKVCEILAISQEVFETLEACPESEKYRKRSKKQ